MPSRPQNLVRQDSSRSFDQHRPTAGLTDPEKGQPRYDPITTQPAARPLGTHLGSNLYNSGRCCRWTFEGTVNAVVLELSEHKATYDAHHVQCGRHVIENFSFVLLACSFVGFLKRKLLGRKGKIELRGPSLQPFRGKRSAGTIKWEHRKPRKQ